MLLCIGEFGEGRPDFGGRRPAGAAAGQKKKRVAGLGRSCSSTSGGRQEVSAQQPTEGHRRRSPWIAPTPCRERPFQLVAHSRHTLRSQLTPFCAHSRCSYNFTQGRAVQMKRRLLPPRMRFHISLDLTLGCGRSTSRVYQKHLGNVNEICICYQMFANILLVAPFHKNN